MEFERQIYNSPAGRDNSYGRDSECRCLPMLQGKTKKKVDVNTILAKAKSLDRAVTEEREKIMQSNDAYIYTRDSGVGEQETQKDTHALMQPDKVASSGSRNGIEESEKRGSSNPERRQTFKQAFEIFKRSLCGNWDPSAPMSGDEYVEFLDVRVFPHVEEILLDCADALTPDAAVRVGIKKQALASVAVTDYEQRSKEKDDLERDHAWKKFTRGLVKRLLSDEETVQTKHLSPPLTTSIVNERAGKFAHNTVSANFHQPRLSQRSRTRSLSNYTTASEGESAMVSTRSSRRGVTSPEVIVIESDSEDSNSPDLDLSERTPPSARHSRTGPAQKRKRSPSSSSKHQPRRASIPTTRQGGDDLVSPILAVGRRPRGALRRREAPQDLEPLSYEASRAVRSRNSLVLASETDEIDRPYLTSSQRRSLETALHDNWDSERGIRWEGQVVHVDFSDAELRILLPSILFVLRQAPPDGSTASDDLLAAISNLLRGTRDRLLQRIASHARQEDDHRRNQLLHRRQADIESFLREAQNGTTSQHPSSVRIARRNAPRRTDFPYVPVKRLVQLKEMGTGHGRQGWDSPKSVFQQTKLRVYDSLKKWRTWPSGGSGDVVTVAWDPNGETFAAGCAALTDDDNMQYNKANNLLLGNMTQKVITDIADHRRPRHRPLNGPNSTDGIFNTMDPWLYYTVSSVAFSSTGQHLATASFDHTVKIWDVNKPAIQPTLLQNLPHNGIVDIVSASAHHPGLLATGAQSIDKGVRVYNIDLDDLSSCDPEPYTSPRALKYPDKKIYPVSLRWGQHEAVRHLLLAGFSSSSNTEVGKDPRYGDLCVFDTVGGQDIKVSPSAMNVFDCVWHPTRPQFASGCISTERVTTGVRSYVRLYHWNGKGFTVTMEFDCPALDMNEVTWWYVLALTFSSDNYTLTLRNPFSQDEFYCTASCTDSTTYVWDCRNPNKILHRLKHGSKPMRYSQNAHLFHPAYLLILDPIQELPEGRPREENDTGVKFAQWGESTDRFYTGSSDGIVKSWNIKRATEDALVCDVAKFDAGIMCGSFSLDRSKLLIGDAAGGIHVLSVALDDDEEEDRLQTFKFRNANGRPEQADDDDTKAPNEEGPVNPFMEGIIESRDRLARGEMRIDRSKGRPQAVRGAFYNGPWAEDEPYASASRQALEADHQRYLSSSTKQMSSSARAIDESVQDRTNLPSRNRMRRLLFDLSADDEMDEDMDLDDTPAKRQTASSSSSSSSWDDESHERPETSEDVEDAYAFDCGIFS
ncbi:MAG: hypothetical protein M1837_001305 [Sclerophora amabilis]|nr:MAG: hypothetical protein M1837_001305 [Sclerophora amabilis]